MTCVLLTQAQLPSQRSVCARGGRRQGVWDSPSLLLSCPAEHGLDRGRLAPMGGRPGPYLL